MTPGTGNYGERRRCAVLRTKKNWRAVVRGSGYGGFGFTDVAFFRLPESVPRSSGVAYGASCVHRFGCQ